MAYCLRSEANEGCVFTGVCHSFWGVWGGGGWHEMHHGIGHMVTWSPPGGLHPGVVCPPGKADPLQEGRPPTRLHPQRKGDPPREYGQWRAVRILLECILVYITGDRLGYRLGFGFQTHWLHCTVENISQTRTPTSYFCTGQESESVSESVFGNVNEP